MSMNFLDAAGVLADSVEVPYHDLMAREAKEIVQATVNAYDALAPDWSQAPDGAQWYTIDADGAATFFDVEPEWEMFEWVIDWRSDPDAPSYPNEPLILDAPKIDVPIGVDWRLLKWQRPEVAG